MFSMVPFFSTGLFSGLFSAGKLYGRDDLLPLISRQPEIVLRSLESAVRASCGAAPGQLQCLELKQLAMMIDLVLITVRSSRQGRAALTDRVAGGLTWCLLTGQTGD
jgi:hypothetical protein